jgi:hypothetical protein
MARSRRGASFSHCLRVRCFFQQQITEPLLEAVDEFQRRVRSQVIGEPCSLLRLQAVAVAAHEREQSAVARACGIEFAPAGQERVVDDANHGEAVGHDARVGEALAHERAIRRREVHAHHADVGFALEPRQIGLERAFRAAENHVIDSVIAQVAERGGVAFAVREEVLVDAEYGGAARRMPLAELALEAVAEIALGRGCADGFTAAQTAAIDAVQVLATDAFFEGFAAALAGQDAGKRSRKASGLPQL